MDFDQLTSLLSKGIDNVPKPSLKETWKEVFSRMVVHSRGVPPDDLIKKTFPNEDEEIMQYRADNYEPITSGVFDKGFDNLYRALSESNWSYDAPQKLKEYLAELTINKINFFQYLFKIVLRRKIEDPNGLLVVLPSGEGVKTKSASVEIKLELVLSSQIYYWDPTTIIYKSCDKSMVGVKVGDSIVEQLAGDVFYIITETNYFTYIQVGNQSENKFLLAEFYPHEIGELPCVVLGGRPAGKIIDYSTGEEEFYYQSDFNAFVAHANEALRDKSIHQGVKVTSAYPIKVMDDMPCDNRPACNNGFLYNDKGAKLGKCQRCNGTGSLIPLSQFKGIVLRRTKEAPFTKGTAHDGNKALEYVYPSVDILKHMGEESDAALLKAEKALQTKMIELAQSGVAKELDREDQYSMLYSFSDYWFDINVKKTITFIGKLLDPNEKGQIKITKPVNFKIKDEITLQEEFTKALQSDVPMGMLVDLYMDWIKKRFSGDELRLKIEEVSIMYIPYYIYPAGIKNEFLLTGIIDKNDYIKSTRVNGILWSIQKEKKDGFFNMTDEQFVTEIDRRMLPFLQQTQAPALPIKGQAAGASGGTGSQSRDYIPGSPDEFNGVNSRLGGDGGYNQNISV